MRSSLKILVPIAAALSGIVSAEAATIPMPAGSTVWMKMNSSACSAGGAGADDCIASNQAGPNPPNGIPLSSFSNGTISATTSAEVLPDQMRSLLRGRSSELHLSFQDTYTVHGAFTGPFNIIVELNATGEIGSLNLGTGFHQLAPSVAEVEIGTFNPVAADIPESQRVSPFPGSPNASKVFVSTTALSTAPFSFPFDITASHTLTNILVGDTFTLAFGLRSHVSVGEVDMLNTAGISFILPDGVFLTSVLGGEFGVQANPVPLPAALPLFATGLGVIAYLARRRKPKMRTA
jgi:hypothetical protein